MLSCCLKCRRNKENKNPKFRKTKMRKTMVTSKYAICGSKKSKFIKEQKASRILRSLEIKILILSEISIADNVLL